MVQDYRGLVDGINQQLLSKYPSRMGYQSVQLAPHQFSRSREKLEELRKHSLRVPGSEQKFAGLQELFETYAKTPENKLINYDQHFMPGLRRKMTTDAKLHAGSSDQL